MSRKRAHGEGTIFQRKDGRWVAEFTDNAGKRRLFYGKTQREALVKMKNAIRDSDEGLLLDKSKILFADWIKEWLEVYSKPNIRKTTYSTYYNFVMNHIVPAFPNVLLKDLRADMLQRFINDKALNGRLDMKKDKVTGKLVIHGGELKQASLAKMFTVITMALKQAVKNKIIPYNVADDIILPPKPYNEKKILTKNEQKRLVELALNNEHPLAFGIFLGLYTGLRIGELLGLKISDINFDKKVIHVKRTVGRASIPGTKKTEYFVNDPKTLKGKRDIPIPEFICNLLKDYITKTEDIRRTLIDIAKCTSDKERWKGENYLFSSIGGKPYEIGTFRNLLNKLLQQAEIEHITIHALRHSFATRAIENGFDIRSLADIMGHSDVKMTLNTYGHALEEQKKLNMEKLTAQFENETGKHIHE